jgi:hypothetical protein
LRAPIAALAVATVLGAPLASTLTTVTTPHSGAIPSAGPTVAASFGPGGGRAGGFPRGVPFGRRGAAAAGNGFAGGPSGNGFAGGPSGNGSLAGGPAGGGSLPGGPATSPSGGGPSAGGAFRTAGGRSFAGGRPGGAFGGGGLGGLLGSSAPSAAVVKLLEEDHGRYTWVAATTGSENASGYQLATDDPVMSIGGFNGTDPAPSLAAFERDVAAGRIHWYIAGGSGFGAGGGASDDAAQIEAWVTSHFTARTVDGVTLYDLATAPRR